MWIKINIYQYFSKHSNTDPKIPSYNIKWTYTTFKVKGSYVSLDTICNISHVRLKFWCAKEWTKSSIFVFINIERTVFTDPSIWLYHPSVWSFDLFLYTFEAKNISYLLLTAWWTDISIILLVTAWYIEYNLTSFQISPNTLYMKKKGRRKKKTYFRGIKKITDIFN